MRTLFLFILLAIGLLLGGQTRTDYSIEIVNEQNKRIKGTATVYCSDTTQVVRFVDGKLSFSSERTACNTLEIRSPSYSVYYLDLSDLVQTYKVVLSNNMNEIDEVVLNKNRENTHLLTSVLTGVQHNTIFKGKKTELVNLDRLTTNLNINNFRQIYANVVGLNIWESDASGNQLDIGGRGLSPKRTSNFNTRQNGYDISADALGYPESYYTPPTAALARIEVVRGAASLQFGPQFGGLLNFQIKNLEQRGKYAFETNITGGQYGFISNFTRLMGQTSDGQWTYNFFAKYTQGDEWRPNSEFTNYNAFGSLKFSPFETFSAKLEYSKMYSVSQKPGGLTDRAFNQDPSRSNRTRNWFEIDWNLWALEFEYEFSETQTINSRSFLLNAKRNALGILSSPLRDDRLTDPRDLIAGTFNNYGNETRWMYKYRLGGVYNTTLVGIRYYKGNSELGQGNSKSLEGSDFKFRNPSDLDKSDYDYNNVNWAGFVEHVFRINDQWSVTPGIRGEHILTEADGYYNEIRIHLNGDTLSKNRFVENLSNDRFFFITGIGINYEINKQAEFYVNWSQNYRGINYSDLRVDNPNYRVDENLKDERGYTADLGIKLNGKSYRTELSLYHIRYNDKIGLILRADSGTNIEYRFRTNIADAYIYGIEWSGELNVLPVFAVDWLDGWNLMANVSYTRAKYDSSDRSINGNEVEQVPNLIVRLSQNLKFRSHHLAFNWSFTNRHFTDASNAKFTSNAINGEIPAYAVMDLSYNYAISNYWAMSVDIKNVTDKRYFTRRAESYPGPGIIPASPRMIYLGISFFLGN